MDVSTHIPLSSLPQAVGARLLMLRRLLLFQLPACCVAVACDVVQTSNIMAHAGEMLPTSIVCVGAGNTGVLTTAKVGASAIELCVQPAAWHG